MPTYFYQQISGFFDNIFNAIRDSKPIIREGAGQALRAALNITSQREITKQINKPPQWYKQCYDEAMHCFDETPTKEKGVTKDDRIHGALIVINELLICSNAIWERKYLSLKFLQNDQNKLHTPEETGIILPRFKPPFLDKHHSPAATVASSTTITTVGTTTGMVTTTASSSQSTATPPQSQTTSTSVSVVHSSRLYAESMSKYGTSVQESVTCKLIMTDNYLDICKRVMEQRTSKSTHVQQTLYAILPRLAAFNREIFVRQYLKDAINILMSTLKGKEKDRNLAYVTLGYIAVAVENEINKYLQRIIEVVKIALPAKDVSSKKRGPVDPSVFMCIGLVSHAVKSGISQDIMDMLDSMLATGLNPALTICLREICENVPIVKKPVSEGLLKMLSQVLLSKSLQQSGTPKHHLTAQLASLTATEIQPDIPTIVLALNTLGTFNFEDQSLLQFVQRCADQFLVNEQQEIRLEAVQTCSRLLKIAIQTGDQNSYISTSNGTSITLKDTISHVLEKLLIVGITDIDPNVRLRVLRSLDETFDDQMAKPEALSALFITLNDEVFEIRELAIMTIGRLSAMNPAYVMPNLRKTLLQLLTELQHSGMSRNKEQSARMLDHLIVSTPRLISSYMMPILKILVPKLREVESNPGVVLNVLRAIGDLAEVNGGSNEMEQWADELLAILLEMLGDSSSPEKRSVALWTLGQLIGATGRVVTPYYKYPFLIDILINFLKTEQQRTIRRETIRVLGLLGALDPYKHKMNKGIIDNTRDNVLISISDLRNDEHLDLSTAEMLVNMGNLLDEYYPAIAISTLMRILRDPTLGQHHTSVVQAVTFIFQCLGIKCVPYLPQVLPNLLENVRTADMNLREFLFQQLSVLIEIVKQHIICYMDDIFKLIKEFWTINTPLQSTLINLMEKIAIALGCEFKIYLSQLIPQILRVLYQDNSKDRTVTIKLLQALQNFGNNLEEYLHFIIPPIVKLFEPIDIPHTVCVAALETINLLAETLDFTDFISRIIHPLIRVLETSPELRIIAMQTLCSMVVQLGRKCLVFIPTVNRVMSKHRISCVELDKLLAKIQSSTTLCLDDEFKGRQSKLKNREIVLSSGDTNTMKKLGVSTGDIQFVCQDSRRVSKDDWLEWLRRLCIGVLKESPSPALRACRALAQNYTKLLRDLFNAAFVSCWTELNDAMRAELAGSLERALEVPDMPELIQTILNLAEFMDHCDKDPLPIDPRLLGNKAMECRA